MSECGTGGAGEGWTQKTNKATLQFSWQPSYIGAKKFHYRNIQMIIKTGFAVYLFFSEYPLALSKC